MTAREVAAHVCFLLGLTSLATLSRYMLTSTESRLQIGAFCLVVAFAEWYLKPRMHLKPHWLLAVLNCVCTTGAIVAVRWHIEGLCPHTWPQCPRPMSALLTSLGI